MGPTNDPSGARQTSCRRRRRPRLSTFALTVRTAALAGAVATILALYLAVQMVRGADPALGGGAADSAPPQPRIVTGLSSEPSPSYSPAPVTSSAS